MESLFISCTKLRKVGVSLLVHTDLMLSFAAVFRLVSRSLTGCLSHTLHVCHDLFAEYVSIALRRILFLISISTIAPQPSVKSFW